MTRPEPHNPTFYKFDHRIVGRTIKKLAARTNTDHEEWVHYVSGKFRINVTVVREIVSDMSFFAWLRTALAEHPTQKDWPFTHHVHCIHLHRRGYFYHRYPFELRKNGKCLSVYAGVVESFSEYRDACRIWPDANIQLLKMGCDGMPFVFKTNQTFTEE